MERSIWFNSHPPILPSLHLYFAVVLLFRCLVHLVAVFVSVRLVFVVKKAYKKTKWHQFCVQKFHLRDFLLIIAPGNKYFTFFNFISTKIALSYLTSNFRNAELLKKGFALPKVTKTGTTIAGIVFKDGVVLGADTRATEGSTVSDKNCEKIHYITNNI